MSDQKRELLVILNEECLEVGICVTKFLRFGKDSTFLKDNPLEQEVGDILAILELLYKTGNLDMDLVSKYRDAKLERLTNPATTNLQYPVKQVQGMNEDRIVHNLKKFFEEYSELDQSKFQINTSGAMVLLGLKDTANDIDLVCSSWLQKDNLEHEGVVFKWSEQYKCHIAHFPEYNIDLHIANKGEGNPLVQFDGLRYQTHKAILEFKEKLNRPKDQKDIQILRTYLGI